MIWGYHHFKKSIVYDEMWNGINSEAVSWTRAWTRETENDGHPNIVGQCWWNFEQIGAVSGIHRIISCHTSFECFWCADILGPVTLQVSGCFFAIAARQIVADLDLENGTLRRSPSCFSARLVSSVMWWTRHLWRTKSKLPRRAAGGEPYRLATR